MFMERDINIQKYHAVIIPNISSWIQYDMEKAMTKGQTFQPKIFVLIQINDDMSHDNFIILNLESESEW